MKSTIVLLAVAVLVPAVCAQETRPLTLEEILFLKKMGNAEPVIREKIEQTGTVLPLSEAEKTRLRGAGFSEPFLRFLSGASGDRPTVGTVRDVISLKRIGRASDVEIKSYVRQKRMRFYLTAADELQLRQAGVSEDLLQFLRSYNPLAETETAEPTPPEEPSEPIAMIEPTAVPPPVTQPPTTRPAEPTPPTPTAPPAPPQPTASPEPPDSSEPPAGDFGITDRTARTLRFHDNVAGYHLLLPADWRIAKERTEAGSRVQAYASASFAPGGVREGLQVQSVRGGYQGDMLDQLAAFVRDNQVQAEITTAGGTAQMGEITAEGAALGGIPARQFYFNETLADGQKLVGVCVVTVRHGSLVVFTGLRPSRDAAAARAAILAALDSFQWRN